MDRRNVLISGGGVAGLTLAIRLKQQGYAPVVIEREPALPAEGYMMDFFGTGWDVAERMGLTEALRAIRYPIDTLEIVDAEGHVRIKVPIERMRRALGNKYVYLRRTDLARILYERARADGIEVRFGVSIKSMQERSDDIRVAFDGGADDVYALVFGADGIHSRVRTLTFGPEGQFERFLGYYVAAFHLPDSGYDIGRACKIYEEPDRMVMLYPLGGGKLDATFILRHPEIGPVVQQRQPGFIRENFSGAGWLAGRIVSDHPASQPLYFDPTMQIAMPDWHRGRVALLGDACGCLTLLAGQGSHMAMAGAYVLARELERHGGDHRAAFAAYQAFLKPLVERKQRDAVWFATMFVPTRRSWPWLRRVVTSLILSAPLVKYTMAYSGAASVLKNYD